MRSAEVTVQIETSRIVPAAVDGSRDVLLLLHGRGSNEDDLLGLRPWLGESRTIVTPRAPFPGGPWGYGAGWAWYRYLRDDLMEEETLDRSLEALDRFIDDLPDRLDFEPSRLVIGGFSQGGTTSLAWALTRPGRVAGVLNLSGFLAGVPGVQKALGNAPGLPVFWGHGKVDPAIPFELGVKGRAALEGAGAQLEVFDHPSGHTITPDEVQAIAAFLSAGLAADDGDA
jgi:phospholipase/carboxylesterase